mmetsp:Transcript_588/g.781  ORF Transcript_588/g.781 Transcript_588/m.781 type:complete len:491 (-) Transcript_588:1417-2889(-)|eukprot:CAMPEP_0204824122 /NCGR_PEP_ID=MMETSP1346-20131115/2164_1 /ASSEMBLY_ACC=CAM_ASM_000771 /TAXON_ID=215587 /ORGANISM="Aplanochytrium stocchinoi, Strain GSBS06" /LENGTH=490 /DNA_ID=CAMNT_0051951101 /DNA_START=97 /DNA_END=1569 /DNA_ORIENTATION=-
MADTTEEVGLETIASPPVAAAGASDSGAAKSVLLDPKLVVAQAVLMAEELKKKSSPKKPKKPKVVLNKTTNEEDARLEEELVKADAEGIKGGPWSEVEDNILRVAVTSYNSQNWTKISEHLPGRTPVQCLAHWRNVLNSKVVKGKGSWTPEEDNQLRAVVAKHGPKSWSSVIAPHLKNRMGKQCRERWHNHLNPDLKKSSWSQDEEKIARQAHEKYGNKWAQIAKLLPGRSDNDVKNHWYASLRRRKSRQSSVEGVYKNLDGSPKKRKRIVDGKEVFEDDDRNLGKWTPEEGATLLALVDKFGPKNWSFIALHLPGRTDIQCLQHWRHVLNPNVVKGRGSWTPEEDKKLMELVQKYGAKKWASAIAPKLPGRMGKQCRERWHNTLNPDLKRGPWGDDEEKILEEAHKEHGNRWAKIAKVLPGRSDNDVKNHFYASLRRKKGEDDEKTDKKKVKTGEKAAEERIESKSEDKKDDGTELRRSTRGSSNKVAL